MYNMIGSIWFRVNPWNRFLVYNRIESLFEGLNKNKLKGVFNNGKQNLH
jgi:hypothetical protein